MMTTTIISGYHGIFWEQIARNWDEYGMELEFEVFWFIGTTIGICLFASKCPVWQCKAVFRDGNNISRQLMTRHKDTCGDFLYGLRIEMLLIDQSARLLCTKPAVMCVSQRPISGIKVAMLQQWDDSGCRSSWHLKSVCQCALTQPLSSGGLVGQLARLWRSSLQQ